MVHDTEQKRKSVPVALAVPTMTDDGPEGFVMLSIRSFHTVVSQPTVSKGVERSAIPLSLCLRTPYSPGLIQSFWVHDHG